MFPKDQLKRQACYGDLRIFRVRTLSSLMYSLQNQIIPQKWREPWVWKSLEVLRHCLCLSVFAWWELLRQEARVKSPWRAGTCKPSPGCYEHLSKLERKPGTATHPILTRYDLFISSSAASSEEIGHVCLCVCVCIDVHMDWNCMVLKPQEIIVGLMLPPDLKDLKILK